MITKNHFLSSRPALPLIVSLVLLWSSPVLAYGPLRSAVDLDHSQVGKVQDIQAEARRVYALQRQRYDRDLRSLRHARHSGSQEQVDELVRSIEAKREELRALRRAEDDAIRDVLRPDQFPAYEAWLNQRTLCLAAQDIRMLLAG